jgi:hypothetical protein
MPLTPFADGPGNTASGVAVYNNDLYLEALANGKEPAFSTWKPWLHLVGAWSGGGGNGTFLVPSSNAVPPVASAQVGSGALAVRFNPTDFAAGTRTTRLMIRSQILASSTSPNLTSVVTNMYPVTMAGSTSSVTATVGTAVTGASYTSPNVVAGSQFVNDQAFNAPGSAGYYGFTATMVTLAASSYLLVMLDVYYQQV